MCFLCAEHTLASLAQPEEAVGEIQRLGNHNAGIAIGPVGRAEPEKQRQYQAPCGKIAAAGAIIVELQTIRIWRDRMQALATARA